MTAIGGAATNGQDTGIVVIGRNEGDRLKACLRSLPAGCAVVYVDSGSSDGSVAFARAQGATVVELPTDRPFTAARARNAGTEALAAAAPAIRFVQMIDGDCTLAAGWIARGRAALAEEDRLAVVFGRRRERFPAASIYNRLCDEEWDVPVGEVQACGGDALFRRDALTAAGGYDPTLIAGEEPDLCLRLGRVGWRVRRIDAEMTLHDAAIHRLGQWWRRTERAGHAYAEHVHRHGAAAFADWRRQVRSILLWGGVLPAMLAGSLLLALAKPAALWIAAAIALLYVVQWARIARRKRAAGASARFATVEGAFLLLGKLAQFAGLLRFRRGLMSGRASGLIEYKQGTAAR